MNGRLNGRRVLIVDDEPATLDVLCASLEAEGCTVLVATSGDAALRAAARSRPDLIVLDVGLPGMNGFETCAQLLANPAMSRTPIIFLSGTDTAHAESHARAAGAADFIRKGLPWSTVLQRIQIQLPMEEII